MWKIGDVQALPPGFDIQAARSAIARRGFTQRLAGSSAVNHGTRTARVILADMGERRRRENDPVEQAASYLRKRGYVVFNQGIIDRASGVGYVVGRRRFNTPAEMMAYARARGWGASARPTTSCAEE